MRIISYNESHVDKTFDIKVQMTEREFRRFDIRQFDVMAAQNKAKSSVDPEKIKEIVYEFYSLGTEIIEKIESPDKKSRVSRHIEIRRMAYLMLKRYTMFSYQKIGRIYDQDHATVMHHVKQLSGFIENDVELAIQVDTIAERIESFQNI